MKSTRSGSGGFVLMDTLVGLGILALLLTVMAVAMGQQRRGLSVLAQRRDSLRLAERALLNLQAGQRLPAEVAQQVRLEPLEAPSPVAAHRWMRVQAGQGAAGAALVGLVHDKSWSTLRTPGQAIQQER